MKIRTLTNLKNIKGKKVLLRVDFNVPMNKKGQIEDDTRIKESLPTIKELKKAGAKIIIVSHLGRPEAKNIKALRLDPIAKHLSKLLKSKVKKSDEVIGKYLLFALKRKNFKDTSVFF